jgi:hypothetical protein
LILTNKYAELKSVRELSGENGVFWVYYKTLKLIKPLGIKGVKSGAPNRS